jgi:hypothetical protein
MPTTITPTDILAAFPGVTVDIDQQFSVAALQQMTKEAYVKIQVEASQSGYNLDGVLTVTQQYLVDLLVSLICWEQVTSLTGEINEFGRNPRQARLKKMVELLLTLFSECDLFPLWSNPVGCPFAAVVTAAEANQLIAHEPLSATSDITLTRATLWTDYFSALVYAVAFGQGFAVNANINLLPVKLLNFYQLTVRRLAAVIIGDARKARWARGDSAGPDSRLNSLLQDGIESLTQIRKQEIFNLI